MNIKVKKSKFSLADKIGWTLAMLLDKLIEIDDFLKKSDQPGTDVGSSGSVPALLDLLKTLLS
ncbi:hypothetical protein [uncultured Desulfobacter sp.]|uniref:hypothetical protein n=1 Tax=uncultured Desulfobacter sp. TaxID=240139 RepID=UPI002AAA789D|nr:hypothetical protein [uncultured Desulfobacter sp.]